MLTFNDCPVWEGDKVDVLVQGAPLDLASTYTAGQRLAPFHVRAAGVWGNRGYSDLHDVDWADLCIRDAGDIDLPVGDLIGSWDAITKKSQKRLKAADTLVTVGGDHSVSLAVLRAYNPGALPVVIHFDAHHDYEITDAPDHGSWLYHALNEVVCDTAFVYGTRGWGYTKKEHKTARKYGATVVRGLPDAVSLKKYVGSRPVHLSVDIDVCDPAYAPGVAFQEPGGWSSVELLNAVLTVATTCNVTGLDVVEVIPDRDPTGITSRLANRVIVQLLTGICLSQRT